MTPPDEGASLSSASSRGRRRSHHACLTCRRKKTRCPGEKPTCSSCVRLQQSCSYPAMRPSQGGRSDERLQHLEEKLDLLLSGRGLTNHATRQGQPSNEVVDHRSDKSYSPTPQPRPGRPNPPADDALAVVFDPDDLATGINLYFKYCHRQPIWCFEREEVADQGSLPEELASSILTLTSRFSEKRHHLQLYSNNAKTLIMLRIANGTVDLSTIESLCLLSFSSFMDGNIHLGQFHLGLSFQLCRSAMLDIKSVYTAEDPTADRKKRLFWSLQLLEQSYGRQEGLLTVPTDIWRPAYNSGVGSPLEQDSKAPPLPTDELGTSTRIEPGIWNTSVYLGWVWSQVRRYVSDCAQNVLKEPWRHDSTYAKVLSDFMELENRIPMCHRYDSVKFYERDPEVVKMNRDYYVPWLKEQVMYHTIPTVLNHPFLYIVGAQHNPNLGIPNTFWRRSSEAALLHATWVVRMIDMVVDKQVAIMDPFFGHAAAIAATVHLYYCCASAARLKHKSNIDFEKCRRFLKSFIPCSAACGALDRSLDKMTSIAAGSNNMEVADWMPSKIYLSVPLMWEILQFNSTTDSQENPTSGLLDVSLNPTTEPADADDESSTLEIIVAKSPKITLNIADGGQEAPTLSSKHHQGGSKPSSSRETTLDTPNPEQLDSLTFNTTPWLYADSSQLTNFGDMTYPQVDAGNEWWEDANWDNFMLNHL
ncbi:L-pipecolate oxidase [Zalerion maritima]|uniref:L-pipecolate oxidase n=1 Tax=Zalerion maritima TaxID=339359 RepID=A0AAD5RY06_9PEZI|nr:L-pipecolate oxidase [Zalerion maritima]